MAVLVVVVVEAVSMLILLSIGVVLTVDAIVAELALVAPKEDLFCVHACLILSLYKN